MYSHNDVQLYNQGQQYQQLHGMRQSMLSSLHQTAADGVLYRIRHLHHKCGQGITTATCKVPKTFLTVVFFTQPLPAWFSPEVIVQGLASVHIKLLHGPATILQQDLYDALQAVMIALLWPHTLSSIRVTQLCYEVHCYIPFLLLSQM